MHHQTSGEEKEKNVSQTNKKTYQNQTLQQESQRNKHLGCPSCKILGTILEIDKVAWVVILCLSIRLLSVISRTLVGRETYSSAEKQSVHSTEPANWSIWVFPLSIFTQRTRKLMMMHKALHLREDGLFVSRKERRLANIEYSMDASILGQRLHKKE